MVHAHEVPAATGQAPAAQLHKGHPQALSRHVRESAQPFTFERRQGLLFAFFGTKDTYRRWGVVNVRSWRKHFGRNTYAIYEGTHYMEEEFLHSMLIPKILEVLGLAGIR